MKVYYNDNDGYCAAWLRRLIVDGQIPKGGVDERSIVDVAPSDLRGFDQCHFFAGIGGWPYALKLAEWPEDSPVWTGSCPCQPLSSAGQRCGHADERHLWPAFYRLIAECRPATIFGEQVASNDGREWLAGVRADLEQLGYAVGCADLPAAGVGTPHVRKRLWWVAATNTDRGRWQGIGMQAPRTWPQKQFERLVQDQLRLSLPSGRSGGVVDGVRHRTPKLRAYGNAIVPQVAAAFIRAYAGS